MFIIITYFNFFNSFSCNESYNDCNLDLHALISTLVSMWTAENYKVQLYLLNLSAVAWVFSEDIKITRKLNWKLGIKQIMKKSLL